MTMRRRLIVTCSWIQIQLKGDEKTANIIHRENDIPFLVEDFVGDRVVLFAEAALGFTGDFFALVAAAFAAG